MPGIVSVQTKGVLNPDLLGAMLAPMLHGPDYQVKTHQEEGFAIATVDLKEGAMNGWAESEDGRYLLVVYGNIYEEWAPRSINTAKALLQKWESSGWRDLTDLHGEYIIVIRDRKLWTLHISNDRLGLKRLNCWQKGAALALASEVKSLAAISAVGREINEFAATEFLTLGHLQENRTLLKDVSLLPSAVQAKWENESFESRKYWDFKFEQGQAPEDLDAYVDAYDAILEKAVRRRLEPEGKTGIFLSGGLAARALAGMMRRVNPRAQVDSWTAGHGHDHDTRFAKMIAKHLRFNHTSVRIPETFLENYLPDFAWYLDGMVSAHGCHRLSLYSQMKERYSGIVLGYLGDRLNGGTPLNKLGSLTQDEELSRKAYPIYATGMPESVLSTLLRKPVYERVGGFVQERFLQIMKSAVVKHPADKVMYWDMTQRQRLWNPIALLDLNDVRHRTLVPFADKDFIDLTLNMPLAWRTNKKAYMHFYRTKSRGMARIPRSGDGLPMIHSRVRAALHWRWVMFERHTLPKLTGGKWGGHNYGSYVHGSEWTKKTARSFVMESLKDNPYLEALFNPEELREFAEAYFDRKTDQDFTEAVTNLVTFSHFTKRLSRVEMKPLHKTEARLSGIQTEGKSTEDIARGKVRKTLS